MKLLEVNDLDLCFYSGKAGRMVHAVDTVSFSMEEGMFLGLAGKKAAAGKVPLPGCFWD